MLSKATFRNFKALRNVELALEPLTVLVGPNGIGKSTALNGLFAFLQMARIAARERKPRWGLLKWILMAAAYQRSWPTLQF